MGSVTSESGTRTFRSAESSNMRNSFHVCPRVKMGIRRYGGGSGPSGGDSSSGRERRSSQNWSESSPRGAQLLPGKPNWQPIEAHALHPQSLPDNHNTQPASSSPSLRLLISTLVCSLWGKKEFSNASTFPKTHSAPHTHSHIHTLL